MQVKFTKMHGLGNDFVVIDAVRQSLAVSAEIVKILADRHFGIGCDQVLIVEPPTAEIADYRYRIFNSDSSEVAQCGNGARCFARFVRDEGLCQKSEIVVETDAGLLILAHRPDGSIRVNMGIPHHSPEKIPLHMDQESTFYRLEVANETVEFGAVSMGNPHAVINVSDVTTAPLQTLGPIMECHSAFPERANIGFMQVVDRQHIKLRVFERGSGETLACGSGACAAVVVGIEQGLLEPRVWVELPGGVLEIQWEGRGSPVMMSGPAVPVFRGEIEI